MMSSPVRGPNENNKSSSIDTTARVFADGVWVMPGKSSSPSMPPTDARPRVVTTMISGLALTIDSLVSGVNAARSRSVPTSMPPAERIISSAPDSLPPSKNTEAVPRT